MNKKILFLVCGVIALGCQKNNPEEQLKHLTGYWEIDKVEVSKDSIINYKVNPTVDYIEFDGKNGFRKKLNPRFDGTYITNDDKEEVLAKIEDDSLRLYYKTPYDSWKETVINAEEDKFSIINRDDKIYYYKKFTPLLADENEKEN